MKTKKEFKKKSTEKIGSAVGGVVYTCEKCGYESTKTFLSTFERTEYRYCLKCVNKFYAENFPKAVLKK